MKIGILGTGHIGKTLVRKLSAAGHDVKVANSRGPDTIEADVLSEGNKRKMSEVGVINQRYAIVLKGNDQKLEVSSNFERLREAVDFKWQPQVWYHLKSRVDIAADGAGVVRAKAWKRGDPEPDAWTIEVKHQTAHQEGSPGLFGFSPQDMRVYVDNIKVAAN